MIEEFQKDGEDRGEIRTVNVVSHAELKSRGITMCKIHFWKKLTDNEVACTICPTALIVNPEVLESLLQN